MPLGLDQILADLGATADDVAASLGARGVKGVRNAARQLNIVVRYVQSQLKEDVASVDLTQGSVLRVVMGSGRPTEFAAVPPSVAEFLNLFNDGGYPHLELPL